MQPIGARLLASIVTFFGVVVFTFPEGCHDAGLDPGFFLDRCTTFLGTPAPSWIDLLGTSTVDNVWISLAIAVIASIAAWFVVGWIQSQTEDLDQATSLDA